MGYKTAVGIDPGLSGGIAIYSDGALRALHRMPLIRGGREDGKDCVDPNAVGAIVGSLRAGFGDDAWGGVIVVLERVGNRPGQSAPSLLTSGRNYGAVETAVRMVGAPLAYVSPQQWHKALGVPKFDKGASVTQKKLVTRAVAERLLPGDLIAKLPKSADGMWEAALLALYGARAAHVS